MAAIDAWVGLDYHQIDCAELADGQLLVFEADTAAIIHLMSTRPTCSPTSRRRCIG